VEIGAKMLSVDTGLSFLSHSVASPAPTASVVRPTIAVPESAHCSPEPPASGSINGPPGRFLNGSCCVVHLFLLAPRLWSVPLCVYALPASPEGTYQYAGPSSTWPCADACLACSFCPRFWVDELPVKRNILTIMGKIGL
jgi:hypothetical protein